MRYNDARGWGTTTNEILKFRKVIELKVHLLYFASLMFIETSMEKDHLPIKGT